MCALCSNDDWTLEVEKLGYKDLSDKVKDLLYTAPPPFSVAVCGGWGSGKTSVLRYLMASIGGRLLRLDPETLFYKTTADGIEHVSEKTNWDSLQKNATTKLPGVWFNPWQHQFEEHPLKALLHEIYNQFSTWGKLKEETKKISTVLLNTGLRILKDLELGPLKVKIDAESAQQIGEAYEKHRFLDQLDSQRFSIAFEQAIAHLASAFTPVKGKGKESQLRDDARVVIFIDDLDRCQARQAFKLLEAIKLFLSTRHCIFVFGIDYHRLIKEFACNVDEFGKSERQSSDYLDKMFQALVPLPLPGNKDFKKFVQKLVVGSTFENHSDMLSEILEKNPRKVKNL